MKLLKIKNERKIENLLMKIEDVVQPEYRKVIDEEGSDEDE